MGLLDRFKKAAPPPPEVARFNIEVNDFTIPVQVFKEKRSNSRVAFGKAQVTMRISLYLSVSEQQQQVETFKDWVMKQIRRHPEKYQRFQQKVYHHGEIIEVGSRRYTLQFQPETGRVTITGKLYPKENLIRFQVPAGVTDQRLAPHVERLLSRIIGAHHLPEIERRVHALNAEHFQRPVGKITLKYNHSNWGSCSAKGNINLSTRLLFAPQRVLDYVIIHELAHRVEMNHSTRFWALVARAMPDYEQQEAWLKQHGGNMNY